MRRHPAGRYPRAVALAIRCRRGNIRAMPDYRSQFRSCGDNVTIAPDAYFECPEIMEVGDNVRFMRGFHQQGQLAECRIGSHVTFSNNCFVEGNGSRLLIADHVMFYVGNYVSCGGWDTSFIAIGHHSHFAPNCVLYGWGGLDIAPYCNIAAHTVFATVGHKHQITDKPMALSGAQGGPITLEEDVWVAANVTITADTRIARGCVIGANAVVTRDTEPMGVYGGVPARRLRDR
jgi:acetyltransferase-like isoleucine patch superfamily enzyme